MKLIDFLYGSWKYNPSKTKIKRPLSDSSSESEHETDKNYQFIILESIEETLITKLSPFFIQKKKYIYIYI